MIPGSQFDFEFFLRRFCQRTLYKTITGQTVRLSSIAEQVPGRRPLDQSCSYLLHLPRGVVSSLKHVCLPHQ
jgi:hypothetical protein